MLANAKVWYKFQTLYPRTVSITAAATTVKNAVSLQPGPPQLCLHHGWLGTHISVPILFSVNKHKCLLPVS